MKPRILKLILWILIGYPSCGYAQSPGGVSTNLTLWVKAETATPLAGGTLTVWTDQVPTHKNVFTITPVSTAAGSGITTVTNIVNFHPIIRFTGKGTLVGNTSITWSECTAVAGWFGASNSERGTVISPTHSGTGLNDASRYYFRAGVEAGPLLFAGMGSDSIGFDYIDPPPATTTAGVAPPLSIYTASGVGDVFNRNGVDAVTGSLYGGFTKRGTTMTDIPQIGDRSTDDSKMNGDIAEIIVYSSNNAANRNKVESYLALKYGLTLGNIGTPVNYTSSGNNIFWTGNTTYQHNIFGIGSDAASGLTQKQSNSMNSGNGDGTGKSALGNLLLTIGSLSDQQFLMIGTDSASLGEEMMTHANGPTIAAGSNRLLRTWKVQNTNSVGTVTLTFEKTGLTLSGGNTASNYYLMIDNDGDGNFKTGTQSFVKASSLAANIITFPPLTLNNNIVFTIITKPVSMLPLAVSWEDFTAGARQHTVSLQWTVAGATDIDHYEVERSADATNFTRTGSLAANTGSLTATGSYSYTFSEQLPPGTYYYRIRMVSNDGNSQWSTVRSVIIAGSTTTLQILSNPITNNQLQLQIGSQQRETTLIRIADRQGNILLQRTGDWQQGNNRVTIDVASLPHGLYYVQAGTEKATQVLAFLK